MEHSLASPKVLNKYKSGIPEGAVYIGRPSKWGNPFEIGKDGDREEVCRKYCEWLDQNEGLKEQARLELRGRDLVCYCAPQLCHGNYLIQVANDKKPKYTEDLSEDDLSRIAEAYMNSRKRLVLIPQIPADDGITHLNIYSKAVTPLGRDLSHFAPIGFTHPDFGRFGSVESFWYWLSTGQIHDHLKPLTGFKAKEEGRKLPRVPYENKMGALGYSTFMSTIEEAIKLKIVQNKWLEDAFKRSILPLTHYYVYGNGPDAKMVPHSTTPWFEYYYNNLRDELCGYTNNKKLKVIVAGSRAITDYALVIEAILTSMFNIGEIVSGGAKGVDSLGERFAKERFIKLTQMPVTKEEWETLGKRAGMIRNHRMGDYADVLVAIWDGQSRGTKDMIDYMTKLGKGVYILRTDIGVVPDGP